MDDLIAKLEAAFDTGIIMEREAIALQRALGLEDTHDTDWKQCCWSALRGSLDAALALAERVLPDLCWSVGQNVHHKHWTAYGQHVLPDGEVETIDISTAATPALALCIAILRATGTKDPASAESL